MKKANPLQYVRSRIEILEQDRDYYENLRKKVVRRRRTKIIATIASYDNANDYNCLRNIVTAGSNGFLINMDQSNHQTLHALNVNRKKLEQELKIHIPIICNLKGSLVRVGILNQPEIFLQKDHEYRIILNNSIIGDEYVIGINDDTILDKIEQEDKLLIDYGQISLTVKSFEKSNETLHYLQEKHNYINFTYQQSIKNNNLEQDYQEQQQQDDMNSNVLVCTVDYDCMIKPYKAIFIQKKKQLLNKKSFDQQEDIDYSDEIDQINQSIVSEKDIKDFEYALQEDVDCISLSNIKNKQEVKAVKDLLGDKLKKVQLICKVQMPEAVENIQGILEYVDAVQIARGYLTVHIPVEKLFFKQKQIIQQCHENYKPIFVSCNILDSMVNSIFPSPSEVGQISNLVSDSIDGIILSGETSHGMHPIETINTLSRICVETEAKQIMKYLKDPSEREISSVQLIGNTIKNCQINCTLEAAYKIQSTLIITNTRSGQTAIQYSKLKPPCTVLAMSSNYKIARVLNLISGTVGYLRPADEDKDQQMDKAIAFAEDQELVQKKDFIVININQTGQIASYSVKVIQIE